MMLDIKVTQKMPQEAVMHALVMYKMQEQGVEGGGGRGRGPGKEGRGQALVKNMGRGGGGSCKPIMIVQILGNVCMPKTRKD